MRHSYNPERCIMKLFWTLSLAILCCWQVPGMASLDKLSQEEKHVRIRPVAVYGYEHADDSAKLYLSKWINTLDHLDGLLIKPIAMVHCAKDFSPKTNAATQTFKANEIKSIDTLEALSKELAFLTVDAINLVFTNHFYHTTQIEPDIENIKRKYVKAYFSEDSIANARSGYPDSSRNHKIPLIWFCQFPFGEVGKRHIYQAYSVNGMRIFRYGSSLSWIFPQKKATFYQTLLQAVNPDTPFDAIESCLRYKIAYIDHDITKPIDTTENTDMSFKPQLFLEKVKVLAQKILNHFVRPYWYGHQDITPEAASQLMSNLNAKCVNIQMDYELGLLRLSEPEKTVRIGNLMDVIQAIEACLLLPKLYEDAFYNTETIRLKLLDKLLPTLME
jgi:hypothetical protein